MNKKEQSIYNQKYYQAHKKELNKKHLDLVYKRRNQFFQGKCCVYCKGTQFLQLHHKIPENKIGHWVWGWKEAKRQKELKKCIILCKNCHIQHHRKFGKKTQIHGTMHSYKNRGCRCKKCIMATTVYCRSQKYGWGLKPKDILV